MKTYANIPYGKTPENLLDLYLPDCEEFPIYIHFHGGGLDHGTKGDTEIPESFVEAKYLTDKGIAVASAEYRKYPDAKYPEYIEDAANAVAWVKNNISDYGKCTKIFVGGSSAGGYLSMMLCFDSKWLKACSVDPSEIDGYIHDAGQPTTHFNILRERGIDNRKAIIDEAAPLYYVGDRDEYPPMKFIVSDNDLPARYEQTKLIIATISHFGYDMSKVEFKLMHGGHVHYGGMCDENNESIYGKLIGDFIEKYI